MNIQEISSKFKHFFEDSELFTTFLLVLVALVSFSLGQMSVSGVGTQNMTVRKQTEDASISVRESVATSSSVYVGSKNSDRYHLPWCSGAQRINEENMIVFNTKAEAENAGYEPAANCKGI